MAGSMIITLTIFTIILLFAIWGGVSEILKRIDEFEEAYVERFERLLNLLEKK